MTTACTDCWGAGHALAEDDDEHGTYDRRVPCHTCNATGEMSDCRECWTVIPADEDYCTECLAEEAQRV